MKFRERQGFLCCRLNERVLAGSDRIYRKNAVICFVQQENTVLPLGSKIFSGHLGKIFTTCRMIVRPEADELEMVLIFTVGLPFCNLFKESASVR
jgi:hypothetical protein